MSPLLALWCVVIIVTCYSESNNAGASTYHGKTNAWPSITLMKSKAKYTHFVYMIADNNLDYFSAYNLEAMRLNTAKMDELNLIVYVDRCQGCDGDSDQAPIHNITNCDTDEPIPGRFNGSKLLQKNGHIWCQIYDFGHELDSMQPQNIANFTALMGQYQLTSTYFMLNFWDHGGAWAGFGSDDHTAMANQNATVDNLDQLFSSVQTGLQQTFIGRLDMLGFDACIMADYSVLHYISEYDITKYYIASEVSEPGVGWDYAGIDASSATVIDYSKAIIDAYVEQGNVQSANAGAGYTLALFDMDKVEKFLNEFGSFIRMITMAVDVYDYGMVMALLRGESSTIAVEKDFAIFDLGLLLQNFISNDNIFWNTCSDRLKLSGQNVLQYLSDAIIYFRADFVRQQMTGSTIFYSTSMNDLNAFYSYNSDLISDNYIEFLLAMNESLTAMQQSSTLSDLTNSSCSAPKPKDLSFTVSKSPMIMYSEDYGLFKLSTEVTATVMTAETYIILSNYTVPLAQIETSIVDKDFDTTTLVSYWDGNIGYFLNSLSVNNSELDFFMFATGQITFSASKNNVPNGYIIKYPLFIYDSLEQKMNASQPNNGYIQFQVLSGSTNNNYTLIPLSSVQLYEINTYSSVISQVKKTSTKIIQGLVTFPGNGSVPTGTLMWPNISIVFVQSLQTEIVVSGNDVFGNFDSVSFSTMDTAVKDWNVSMGTRTPTASPTMSNMMTTETTEGMIERDGDTKSNGLDVVPSFVWLIIIGLLVIAIVILAVLFSKARQASGLIVDQSYVQMTD